MKSCSDAHKEVYYETPNCPACELLRRAETAEIALADVLERIKELQQQLKLLLNTQLHREKLPPPRIVEVNAETAARTAALGDYHRAIIEEREAQEQEQQSQ